MIIDCLQLGLTECRISSPGHVLQDPCTFSSNFSNFVVSYTSCLPVFGGIPIKSYFSESLLHIRTQYRQKKGSYSEVARRKHANSSISPLNLRGEGKEIVVSCLNSNTVGTNWHLNAKPTHWPLHWYITTGHLSFSVAARSDKPRFHFATLKTNGVRPVFKPFLQVSPLNPGFRAIFRLKE